MAALTRFVSSLMLASLSVFVLAAGGGVAWRELTASQQAALMPLAPIWDGLPAGQRAALLKLGAGYGGLDARGQRLFHERLLQWTLLTPAQRQLARDNYRRFIDMPAAQQAQLRQRWQQACEPRVKP
jgi:hypothetical protein